VNQLLDGSMSLSPLYSHQTIDLHVRIATSLHQSFLWLRRVQAKITTSFGSHHVCSDSNPFPKERPVDGAAPPGLPTISHFRYAKVGFLSRKLAYMLDSLVRVSRRGERNHFVDVPNVQVVGSPPLSIRVGAERFGEKTLHFSPRPSGDFRYPAGAHVFLSKYLGPEGRLFFTEPRTIPSFFENDRL
jgi:hypothetical protein